MAKKSDELKQKDKPSLIELQDNYENLSNAQKLDSIKKIVDYYINDTNVREMFTRVRQTEPKGKFGENMSIDVAYMMFPDSRAA